MNEVEMMLRRIKAICKTDNISYKELSGMTGISISTLSKIMSGVTKDPTITSISKIACALNSTIDFLVFGEERRGIELTPYDLLNDVGRDKVKEYINDLLDNAKYVRKLTLYASEGTEKETRLSEEVIKAIVKAYNASDKPDEE